MKYALVTFVDEEKSFSCYKSILKSNKRNLKFENLKLYAVLCLDKNKLSRYR
jgi:hypothetical protein